MYTDLFITNKNLEYTLPYNKWTPTELSNIFHNLPHLDSDTDNFDLDSSTYLSSLGMGGALHFFIWITLLFIGLMFLILYIAEKRPSYVFDSMCMLLVLLLTSAGLVLLALILELVLHFLIMKKMSFGMEYIQEVRGGQEYPSFESHYAENLKFLKKLNEDGLEHNITEQNYKYKINMKCGHLIRQFNKFFDTIQPFGARRYGFTLVAKAVHNPFSKKIQNKKRTHIAIMAVLWLISIIMILLLILLFNRIIMLMVALIIVILWLFVMIGLLISEAMGVADACQEPDELSKWLDTKEVTFNESMTTIDEPSPTCVKWVQEMNLKMTQLVTGYFAPEVRCVEEITNYNDYSNPLYQSHFLNGIEELVKRFSHNPEEVCPNPIRANALVTHDTIGTLRSFCKNDVLLGLVVAQILAVMVAALLLTVILVNFIKAKMSGWSLRRKNRLLQRRMLNNCKRKEINNAPCNNNRFTCGGINPSDVIRIISDPNMNLTLTLNRNDNETSDHRCQDSQRCSSYIRCEPKEQSRLRHPMLPGETVIIRRNPSGFNSDESKYSITRLGRRSRCARHHQLRKNLSSPRVDHYRHCRSNHGLSHEENRCRNNYDPKIPKVVNLSNNLSKYDCDQEYPFHSNQCSREDKHSPSCHSRRPQKSTCSFKPDFKQDYCSSHTLNNKCMRSCNENHSELVSHPLCNLAPIFEYGGNLYELESPKIIPSGQTAGTSCMFLPGKSLKICAPSCDTEHRIPHCNQVRDSSSSSSSSDSIC